MKMLRRCVPAAVVLCLLVARPLAASEGITGNLVSAAWLERNRNNADVLILDASPAKIYTAKHIPGAINVDFLIYGFPERSLGDMEQRYQSWGVSPGKKIVMYDQGGTYLATRLLFSLHHHGFPVEDLLVLDGGLAKWEEQGLPVTAEATAAPPKGTFRITKVHDDVRSQLPEVLAASGDPANHALVEALGPEWHYGEVAPFDRAGHIPGSVLLPAADFFNADKTFKSAEEIRRMLAYMGVGPEQRIHSYCGGGIAASVPYFALKFIANYPKVSLFVESEVGWLTDERELPYWTYDAPFLLREGAWLQSWGSRMLRTYGVSRISVVDVRPAAAYSEGHVMFALNVPADVFRANLANPAKLAEMLGAAGVDPTHEAIVMSGGGLTPDSALAFLALEKLGQKKVSVLADSLDEWATRGFSLTKVPTVVGSPKSPEDFAVAPATYAADPRGGIIISDPASSQGVYPKVFIASGREVPANPPGGPVVHLPYATLLNADGTPKVAKEIWKILSTAGVPRYAELVCFSDDPGEAAVTYFVLKLMGFPDVKVWAR